MLQSCLRRGPPLPEPRSSHRDLRKHPLVQTSLVCTSSSPAWKTCRLVRSMRRVTCCPASGLPSQIWRPAANTLPLAGTTPTYSSPSCRTRLEPGRTGGPCILGSTAPPAGRVNAHVRQTLPLRPRLRILGVVEAINKAPISPPLCAASAVTSQSSRSVQNGGSARDYLLGFAWFGAPVMVQRASGLSVCLFIGALGVNFRI